MAEDLRTLREAAIALDGLGKALGGKINMLIWVISGLGAIGAGLSGGILYKVSDMNATVARLEVQSSGAADRLGGIETRLDGVVDKLNAIEIDFRSEFAVIREALKVPPEKKAEIPITPETFRGMKGALLPDTTTLEEAIAKAGPTKGQIWIHTDQPNLIEALDPFRQN